MAAIRTIWSSVSRIAMTMVSDILSLGEEGRINIPSTLGGNWCWRVLPGQLTDEHARNLAHLTWLYRRNHQKED